MQKKRIRNIIYTFIIISLIVVGVYKGILWKKDKKNIEKNYEVVTGIITKSKSFIHRGSNEIVSTIEYKVDEKSYKTVLNTFSVGLEKGDSCTLRYEVGNPKNCEIYK